MEQRTLHLDIETFSSTDLARAGVYRYAESPDFRILLIGYAFDEEPVRVIDLASGEFVPDEVIAAINSEEVIKIAHNAMFERVCLSRFLDFPTGAYLSPSSWRCTMIWSAYLGLPMSLKGVGSVLKLDEQKMDEGKDLIRYFCVPCTPTKTNGGRTRNLPTDAPEKWKLFREYNARDVEVEMSIGRKLSVLPVPDFVWEEYTIDQEINDRGVLLDMKLVDAAITIDMESRKELENKMKTLTGIDNPNSVQQMTRWLGDNGTEMDSLGKKDVVRILPETDGKVREALSLRLKLAKSSVKKYQAMADCVCSDGRARGCFQFYGSHTGRFAGRHIQFQNLSKNHMEGLETARDAVKTGDYELVSMLYDDVPDLLSQLVRTALIPEQGHRFIVCDYTSIELVVSAYLAGETWVTEAFRQHKDVYSEVASKMFHCPVVKNGINGKLRQKGKQATLSCSYQGSVGALKAMGALDSGMKEEELKPLVDAWREANPNIVRFWYDCDSAAQEAVRNKARVRCHGMTFSYEKGFLFITLLSGRRLAYVKPKIEINDFGLSCVSYEGTEGTTRKWTRLQMFPGRWVENIVQATARDILCEALKNLRGTKIVCHIHDEIIIEAPLDLEYGEVLAAMTKSPIWAQDLELSGDGGEMEFYMKT